MLVEYKTEPVITLKLNLQEASFLKWLMQNPIDDFETEMQNAIRKAFWNALENIPLI